MPQLPQLAALVCLAAPLCAGAHDCRELAEMLRGHCRDGTAFALEASVTEGVCTGGTSMLVHDAKGAIALDCQDVMDMATHASPGDRIRTEGCITTLLGDRNRPPIRRASCRTMAIVGKDPPPSPTPINAGELLDGSCDFKLVQLDGVVADVVRDDIDPRFLFLTLSAGGSVVYVTTQGGRHDEQRLRALVGARVRVTGISNPAVYSNRMQIGRTIGISGPDSMEILSAPPKNAYDAPDAESLVCRRRGDIPTLVRHTASGQVVAVWRNGFLVRTGGGYMMRIQSADESLPAYGDFVQAVGLPDSDFFNISLKRAMWRQIEAKGAAEPETPEDITARSLLPTADGRVIIDMGHHGGAVRIEGQVIKAPSAIDPDKLLYVESLGNVFTVDATAVPECISGIEAGFTVSIAGTCVMEVDAWRSAPEFPQVRGFIIAPRFPDDVRIVKRPPWLTPGRFAVILGILAAALAGSAALNFLLRRLITRRNREIEAQVVARIGSEFKVRERTRLAVELHDSISQNLTGATLEIRTAAAYAGTLPPEAQQHLAMAQRILGMCRNELRNCLYDLRSDALELQDMGEAIRRTVAMHLGQAELSVRFEVPRDRLSDSTAHDILHIIRELVGNAVRHGHATRIYIAGAIEGDRFMFSVRDNGCGFHVDECPGVEQRHFGLAGIRERIKARKGEFTVESKPGRGTRATVVLTVPKEPAT